jgi:maleylpyruvate isomerase
MPSSPASVLELLDETTAIFFGAIDTLDDAAWDDASLLPDWRRREVVAHVHHNAEALQNLAFWARTGEERRMYASREQRDRDIEQTAGLPVAELRTLVRASADALRRDLSELDECAWQREVVTAGGRTVPATEVPWMRCREVAVHAVDLGSGLRFADLPDAFLSRLVEDVVRFRSARGEGAVLAAWLTGRAPGRELGPWV